LYNEQYLLKLMVLTYLSFARFVNIRSFLAMYRTIAQQAVTITGDYKDAGLL